MCLYFLSSFPVRRLRVVTDNPDSYIASNIHSFHISPPPSLPFPLLVPLPSPLLPLSQPRLFPQGMSLPHHSLAPAYSFRASAAPSPDRGGGQALDSAPLTALVGGRYPPTPPPAPARGSLLEALVRRRRKTTSTPNGGGGVDQVLCVTRRPVHRGEETTAGGWAARRGGASRREQRRTRAPQASGH